MTRMCVGFPRVTVDPQIMAGKPCIRGTRVTLGMILGNLGAGTSMEELLGAYPYLERADILEAIRFGSQLASGPHVDLTAGALVTVESRKFRVRRLSAS